MAEIIGLVASIITFVDVASKVVSRLQEYHALAKDVPEVFRNVSTQLPLVIDVMGRIKHGCKDGLVSAEAEVSLLRIVQETLRQINMLEQMMDRVLPTPTDSSFQRRRKALRYLREAKRINTITASIEDHKSTLTLHYSQISYDAQQHSKKLIYSSWLRPLEVSQILAPKVEGTCDWIWSRNAFMEWHDSPILSSNKRLLRVSGPQGCGKSVLASSVFQELRKRERATLFFPFSAMNHDRQELHSMARSLLGQLLQYLPDRKAASIMDKLMLKDPFASSKIMETFEEALSLVAGSRPVYCIVDGVDESSETNADVLNYALKLLALADSTRILLFGRPHTFQTSIAFNSPLIEVDILSNGSDIDRFIESEVDRVLTLADRTLRGSVIQILRERSDGIFLWVRLMIGNLKDAATKGDIMQRLNSSQRGLEQIYTTIFEHLTKTLTESQLVRARKLFAYAATACRSPSMEELRYMFALEYDGPLENNLPISTSALIPGTCGDLLSTSDDQVRLIHVSLKDFLTRPMEAWIGVSDKAALFRVNIEEMHQTLGNSCLRYMTMDPKNPFSLDTPADMDALETARPFFKYAARYAFSHLIEVRQPHSTAVERVKEFVESNVVNQFFEYITLLIENDVSESMILFELHSVSSTIFERSNLQFRWTRFLSSWASQKLRHDSKSSYQDWSPERIQLLMNDSIENEWDSQRKEAARNHSSEAKYDTAAITRIMQQLKNFDVLPISGKVASLIGFYSRLRGCKHLLMDPLRILFKMLLQSANSVPVYVLLPIGQFYLRLGKHNDALEIFRAALKKVEHQESFAKFATIEAIGKTFYRQKQWANAESMYRQSLAGKTDLFGIDHPTTQLALLLLSRSLGQQIKYDEQEKTLRTLLELRKKKFGKLHPKTLYINYSIGFVLYSQERFDEAEHELRYTVQHQITFLGIHHEDTKYSTMCLLNTLYYQNKHKDVESCARQILLEAGEKSEKGDRLMFEVIICLARSLLYQSKNEETEKLLLPSINDMVAVHKENDMDILRGKTQLSRALASKGDYLLLDEMYTHAMKLIALRKTEPSELDLETFDWFRDLAFAHSEVRKYERSEEILRFILMAIGDSEDKDVTWRRWFTSPAEDLYDCLLSQGKYKEAVYHIRQSMEAKIERFGYDCPEAHRDRLQLGGATVESGNSTEGECIIYQTLNEATSPDKPLNDSLVDDICTSGDFLLSNDRFGAAESVFRLCADNPRAWESHHYDAWYCLVKTGNTLLYRNEFEEAENIFKRAVRESALYPSYDRKWPMEQLSELWEQRDCVPNDSEADSHEEKLKARKSWGGSEADHDVSLGEWGETDSIHVSLGRWARTVPDKKTLWT